MRVLYTGGSFSVHGLRLGTDMPCFNGKTLMEVQAFDRKTYASLWAMALL